MALPTSISSKNGCTYTKSSLKKKDIGTIISVRIKHLWALKPSKNPFPSPNFDWVGIFISFSTSFNNTTIHCKTLLRENRIQIQWIWLSKHCINLTVWLLHPRPVKSQFSVLWSVMKRWLHSAQKLDEVKTKSILEHKHKHLLCNINCRFWYK